MKNTKKEKNKVYKKHNIYCRILAFLLTMMLLCTSSGVQVLAQEMSNDPIAGAVQTEGESNTENITGEAGSSEDPVPTGDPQATPQVTSEENSSEGSEATPTPTVDPEATPTGTSEDPIPSQTPTSSEDPMPSSTPTSSEDPTPSSTPTSSEDPTPSSTPDPTQDQLTFEIVSTSLEEETGLVEIKVHYSLGEDSEESIRTRLYMEGQTNMDFPQFESIRYTDDDGHSFKLSSNPNAQKYYIQYYVNPGEDFVQTFKVSVPGLEAGESAGFTARLEVGSNPIPENWTVDSNVYNLTYTQSESGESNAKSILDLAPGESMTVQATFGGARSSQVLNVTITADDHEWVNYGVFSDEGYRTRPYHVSFVLNGDTITGKAFCIQPPAVGPTTSTEYEVSVIDNDTFAKVCYYVNNPGEGFFAEDKNPNTGQLWNDNERFVLGHIASAKLLESGDDWAHKTNQLAQEAVDRFIKYCQDSKSISFSPEELTVDGYYKDSDGNWRQKSTTTTFNAVGQSYTTSLYTGIQLHLGGSEYSNTATVGPGGEFFLSAPLTIDDSVNSFKYESVTQTLFAPGSFKAYKLVTTQAVQNLALVFGDAEIYKESKTFSATFTTGSASISVNKTDGANELNGAEFNVIATNVKGVTAGAVVASFTTENGIGNTGVLPPGSYTLQETKAPSGYVVADNISFTIADNGTVSVNVENIPSGVSFDATTNTFTVVDEKNETSISGEKTWKVPSGFQLPKSITVRLLRDGNPIYESATSDSGDTQKIAEWTEKIVTVGTDGKWTYNWTGLPKYPTDDNGKKTGIAYTYTVVEVGIDGTSNGNFTLNDGRGTFESTVSGTNIINKITGTTEVSGEKIWHDDGDSDGIRPDSITVKLLQADKSKVGTSEESWTELKTETVSKATDWKYSFTGLKRYSDDGLTEYVYSVDESNVPSGYTKRIEGYDIINTHVASTSAWFTGKKELEGRTLLDKEFTFNLYEVTSSGEVVRKLQTTTNNVNGSFYFNSISYSGSGTHYYRITEEKETLGGVIYDETVYDIRVVVSVGGVNNDYYTTTKYITKVVGSDKTTVNDIVFNNKYQASGELVIRNIMKTLENSPLVAGQFTFELKDEQGNVLQTATNNADGSVIFGALKYTEKDIDKEYTYTVSEVNNNVTGVTYDNTVYTVKVKVQDSDPSDGTLRITQETFNDVTAVDTMTYTNTFKGSVKLYKTGEDDVVLPDAKFQLYVQNGSGEWVLYKADETTPEEYVTDENGMIVVDNLVAGNYYFVETEAPIGYVVSKEDDGSSKKYYFTIGIKDGDAGIVENAEVDQELNIENEVNPEDTTIEVTKLITRYDEDFELIDETFYVALFEDEELTDRVSEIKAIEFKNASASTVYFTDLKFGKTYYVAETDVDGNVIESGVFGEDGSFVVDFASGNYAEIDRGNGMQTIIFENQILEIPREYYKEGELTITKKLLGSDGSAKSSTGIFYAGIFADKEYTQLSDLAEENIVKLDLNGNSSVSKTVKIALHPEDETVLYVTEVDENGKPVANADGFKYTVTVDETKVTMDAENTKASVVITNREEESSSSETVSTSSSNTQSGGTTRSAVRTGDDTPIAPFASVLGISMLAILALAVAQKRRKRG